MSTRVEEGALDTSGATGTEEAALTRGGKCFHHLAEKKVQAWRSDLWGSRNSSM